MFHQRHPQFRVENRKVKKYELRLRYECDCPKGKVGFNCDMDDQCVGKRSLSAAAVVRKGSLLVAGTQLYEWLCPSLGLSVSPSVGWSVGP